LSTTHVYHILKNKTKKKSNVDRNNGFFSNSLGWKWSCSFRTRNYNRIGKILFHSFGLKRELFLKWVLSLLNSYYLTYLNAFYNLNDILYSI